MDNYAEFIERIDTASTKLGARQKSLLLSLRILETVFKQNDVGAQLWAQRRSRADDQLAHQAGNPEAQRVLTELRGVAASMEPMFRTRVERLRSRVVVVRKRSDEIDRSLNDLARSRLKLETSRTLTHERENLRRAMADVAGTLDHPVVADTDVSVREDLDRAREAIIMAEALLELKEN